LNKLAKEELEVKTTEELFTKIRNEFEETTKEKCHDLAKWLSHYFFSFLLFSNIVFLFFFFSFNL